MEILTEIWHLFQDKGFDDLHDNNLVCGFEKTADKLLALLPYTCQLLQFDDRVCPAAFARLKRVGPSGQMPARSPKVINEE